MPATPPDPGDGDATLRGYRAARWTPRHPPPDRPRRLDEEVTHFGFLALLAMAATAAGYALAASVPAALAGGAGGAALLPWRLALGFGQGMLVALLIWPPLMLAGAPLWIGLRRLFARLGARPRAAAVTAALPLAALALPMAALAVRLHPDAVEISLLRLAVVAGATAPVVVALAYRHGI
jgi:hypothetical protein